MRLFGRRGSRSEEAMPMGKAAWSPEEQIRELRIGLSVVREQVVRFERIITASGTARRQEAGWLVSPGTSKEKFVADVPGEASDNMR